MNLVETNEHKSTQVNPNEKQLMHFFIWVHLFPFGFTWFNFCLGSFVSTWLHLGAFLILLSTLSKITQCIE